MTDGLACECAIPLAWHAVTLAPEEIQSRVREAALVLAALNQIESARELESSGPENRRLDRIEAKLDLTLHLLARMLESDESSRTRPAATARTIKVMTKGSVLMSCCGMSTTLSDCS